MVGIQTSSLLLQVQEAITKAKRNSRRRYCHEGRARLIKIMAKLVTSKINTINYLNSTKLNPLEANHSLAGQEIPGIVRNPKVHNHIQ
jgi:hypothetical protein